MQSILQKIVNNKFNELRDRKRRERDFVGSIIHPRAGNIGVIAEIKLASPTAGLLGRPEDVYPRAVTYERGGADAISVVVDNKYFGGRLDFIRDVKNMVSLPVLMKDFIIDPYQIYEAKMIGADALLFIAKILTKKQLKEFVALAFDLGIEPVVEVGNEKELEAALETEVSCIGVNARNLTDFNVDVDQACKLIRIIPKDRISLGFSGVTGQKEVKKYKEAGVKAVLVGTALMKSEKPERLTRDLRKII